MVKKQNKSTPKGVPEHGFMYIGHLPHGFYEDEIKSYFSQFGQVARVRLSRSKKTGNCRGFGFVEFKNINEAKIAAETMNNYLMFNKVLKCHLIPKEKIHPETFKNAGKDFVKPLASWNRMKFNSAKTKDRVEVFTCPF